MIESTEVLQLAEGEVLLAKFTNGSRFLFELKYIDGSTDWWLTVERHDDRGTLGPSRYPFSHIRWLCRDEGGRKWLLSHHCDTIHERADTIRERLLAGRFLTAAEVMGDFRGLLRELEQAQHNTDDEPDDDVIEAFRDLGHD